MLRFVLQSVLGVVLVLVAVALGSSILWWETGQCVTASGEPSCSSASPLARTVPVGLTSLGLLYFGGRAMSTGVRELTGRVAPSK